MDKAAEATEKAMALYLLLEFDTGRQIPSYGKKLPARQLLLVSFIWF
jgi:hypothetical protein